jgi:hypothetical protein
MCHHNFWETIDAFLTIGQSCLAVAGFFAAVLHARREEEGSASAEDATAPASMTTIVVLVGILALSSIWTAVRWYDRRQDVTAALESIVARLSVQKSSATFDELFNSLAFVDHLTIQHGLCLGLESKLVDQIEERLRDENGRLRVVRTYFAVAPPRN